MILESIANDHSDIEVYPSKVISIPLVSICIQTYNHANFIAECLEGILNQDCNFHFEILLGEDDSTDGTREICIEYANKYPDKIRLFLHSRSNVIYIHGKPTGRFNFLYNLSNAKGKYIALCDGDDIWISKNKLQIQVDFLEKNSSFAMSFHNVNWTDPKGQFINTHSEMSSIIDGRKKFTFQNVVDRWFMPTSSIVFRKSLLPQINDKIFTEVASGDILISAIISSKGSIYYHDEILGNYRRHIGGVSTSHRGFFLLSIQFDLLVKLDSYLSSNSLNKSIKKGIRAHFRRFFDNESVKSEIKKGVLLLRKYSVVRFYVLYSIFNLMNLKFFKFISWRILK